MRFMVATSGFGVGIDNSDVVVVIVFAFAYGVLALAQMAGRAGRAGSSVLTDAPAACVTMTWPSAGEDRRRRDAGDGAGAPELDVDAPGPSRMNSADRSAQGQSAIDAFMVWALQDCKCRVATLAAHVDEAFALPCYSARANFEDAVCDVCACRRAAVSHVPLPFLTAEQLVDVDPRHGQELQLPAPPPRLPRVDFGSPHWLQPASHAAPVRAEAVPMRKLSRSV